jgi:hypothetical protein
VRKTATASRLVLLVTTAVFINYIDRGKSGHGAAAAQSTGGASLALIPAARAFAARWLLQRNENPALLQPIGKTYGQSADALKQPDADLTYTRSKSKFRRLVGARGRIE